MVWYKTVFLFALASHKNNSMDLDETFIQLKLGTLKFKLSFVELGTEFESNGFKSRNRIEKPMKIISFWPKLQ